MNEKGYPFEAGSDGLIYKFESVSANKKIVKTVLLSSVSGNTIYNLALLDPLGEGEYSDQVESRNGDLREVLATVFQIINDFLDKCPHAMVGFQGSDARRQRLYRIAITHELSNISRTFEVYGLINNETIVPFEPNTDYDHYLIKKI
ncbi:DUF6934 family protein [Dyadobacter sp. MSC1_007]|jgi:hypothetical protein|uniref:DUF6934 family protein n=1 Tax=Dyadobacter sp. MSC1_007 TaxID=2909264 RepID=UPI00202DF8AF|nr:hypothetical protein [Dyadobacter sp. MSC1_007]